MVEAVVFEELVESANGAGLGVADAEDDARNAGQDDGPGAHRAGFEGDVERGAEEPPVAHGLGGLGDGDHFGVGGGVVQRLALVVGPGDDAAVADDATADGHLVGVACGSGFAEGHVHESFVGGFKHGRFQAGKKWYAQQESNLRT